MNFFRTIPQKAVTLLCLFAYILQPVMAQVVTTPPPPPPVNFPDTESDKVRNGFGEALKPKLKRTQPNQNLPYTPIKKQDDQSQIPEIEMFVGESRVFPAPGAACRAPAHGAQWSNHDCLSVG